MTQRASFPPPLGWTPRGLVLHRLSRLTVPPDFLCFNHEAHRTGRISTTLDTPQLSYRDFIILKTQRRHTIYLSLLACTAVT